MKVGQLFVFIFLHASVLFALHFARSLDWGGELTAKTTNAIVCCQLFIALLIIDDVSGVKCLTIGWWIGYEVEESPDEVGSSWMDFTLKRTWKLNFNHKREEKTSSERVIKFLIEYVMSKVPLKSDPSHWEPRGLSNEFRETPRSFRESFVVSSVVTNKPFKFTHSLTSPHSSKKFFLVCF